MSERDHPGVMPGKLNLDLLSSPSPRPAEATLPRIDMGVTSGPTRRLPTGGLPPWLRPELMGPMFGQFGDGLDGALQLPADFPGPVRPGAHGRWGKNDAGVGVTTGDWQIGGTPATSTSDRFDTPATRSRAERVEQDERDARSRGEKTPDPVGDGL